MKVKIVNQSRNELPAYATKNSAGVDIRSNNEIIIPSGGRMTISTGLFMEIEVGYEAQIRPRSGLAVKHGLTVLNSPGTIDADYRGEVLIILINHNSVPMRIEKGDRICQMVFSKVEQAEFEEVEKFEELSETERGEGGIGSTGIN